MEFSSGKDTTKDNHNGNNQSGSTQEGNSQAKKIVDEPMDFEKEDTPPTESYPKEVCL